MSASYYSSRQLSLSAQLPLALNYHRPNEKCGLLAVRTEETNYPCISRALLRVVNSEEHACGPELVAQVLPSMQVPCVH